MESEPIRPLAEQYEELLRDAEKNGAFGVWRDARGWLVVRGVADDKSGYALAYADNAIQKEKVRKQLPPDAPEFAPRASERLGEALRTWAKEVAQIWEGKGFLMLRNYHEEETGEMVERILRFMFNPETFEEGGAERLDDQFLEILRKVGTAGEKYADSLAANIAKRREAIADAERNATEARERGEEPKGLGKDHISDVLYDIWEEGPTDPPRWAKALSAALWLDRVRPEIAQQQERERTTPAALTRVVSVDVLDAYSRHRYKEEERNGQRTFIFPQNRGWVVVPSVTDRTISAILDRGFDLLGTELGIDLLEWQITTAHQQWQRGDDDFRNIRIEGGWRALATDYLGKNSKADVDNVRKIVLTQAHMRFETGGRVGNLLTYDESVRATRGRRSIVTITLGDMLLKGFVHALKETHGKASLEAREGQRLVPILGKAPLVGKQRNSYAAQRRMVWRFAVALRDSAAELAKEGSVRMPQETWARLADEAGLPRSTSLLAGIRSAWAAGDDKAPALIVVERSDRVRLHESRKTASDFIVDAGLHSIESSKKGKAAAEKRAIHKRKHA